MMINDRIKKILRASTLAIIAMPIASYWTTNVYADPPANCYDLRTLDEIYTRSQSREASRAESDAHVKIAQIQADAQYRIEQLKATQENMRAERGSQSVLDHATIANAAIQTNATIEIEKIKADLEKARMEDARYREQLATDKAQAKTEADKAIKQEQINSDKEIALEQIRADKAIKLQQIEAEGDKARLAAAAKARLEALRVHPKDQRGPTRHLQSRRADLRGADQHRRRLQSPLLPQAPRGICGQRPGLLRSSG